MPYKCPPADTPRFPSDWAVCLIGRRSEIDYDFEQRHKLEYYQAADLHMNQPPLPIQLLERLIAKMRYPVLWIGIAVVTPLLLLFFLTGVIYPDSDAVLFERPLESTGLFLMMSTLTAYVLMCFTGALRSGASIHASLDPLLGNEVNHVAIRSGRMGFWPVGVMLGVYYALNSNIVWSVLSFDVNDPAFMLSVCLVFGQVLMWSAIGFVLFFSIHEGIVLHRLGKLVKIDLYNLDSLNGFGRSALTGFLFVAGALALTTLQSLDREFQVDEYINGLYVGIPAAILLVLLPIWSIHRRIRAEKARHIESVNSEISKASQSFEDEPLLRLNALLVRRDQIRELRSWPMDLSIFSRFVFYVFIPPLAWTGAALMEVFLDSYLGV